MSDEPNTKKPDPQADLPLAANDNGGWAVLTPQPAPAPAPVTPEEAADNVIVVEEWRDHRSRAAEAPAPEPAPVELEEEHGGGGGGPPSGDSGGGDDDARPAFCSDDALAEALAERVVDSFKYVPDWGWLYWDEKQWAFDKDDAEVTTQARFNVRRFAARLANERLARIVCSGNTIGTIVRLARKDRRVRAEAQLFDNTSRWLLNTPEGIVDLRTGVLGPHYREAYLCNMTAVSPAGDCPMWKEFIRYFCGGDEAYMLYLQRLAGFCLTGWAVRPNTFFLYGARGREGKGVYIHTLQNILGDYAASAALGMFGKTTGERHPTEVMALRGKRLVTATETAANQEWDTAKIKSLTGGDKIGARFSRADMSEYVPILKLLMSGNYKPTMFSSDGGFKDRFNLLPANHRRPDEEQDPFFEEKLQAEYPGILLWAIEGACMWYKNGKKGLDPPPIVLEATDTYFFDFNLVERFIAARCERVNADDERTQMVPTKTLYGAFKKWQETVGEKWWSQNTFIENLKKVSGVRPGRSKKANGWRGLRLIDEDGAPELGLE